MCAVIMLQMVILHDEGEITSFFCGDFQSMNDDRMSHVVSIQVCHEKMFSDGLVKTIFKHVLLPTEVQKSFGTMSSNISSKFGMYYTYYSL
jgi:hypothetical protein